MPVIYTFQAFPSFPFIYTSFQPHIKLTPASGTSPPLDLIVIFQPSMQARVSFFLTPLLRSFAGTKLMMRNLPWTASKDEITSAIQAVTPFEKLELPINLDGRNRGFGFLVFATEADKDKATIALETLEISGRKVSVQEYIENARGERPPRTGGFQRRSSFSNDGQAGSDYSPRS